MLQRDSLVTFRNIFKNSIRYPTKLVKKNRICKVMKTSGIQSPPTSGLLLFLYEIIRHLAEGDAQML